MRKYKKFTALSMSALLMAGVMAGCGSSADSTSTEETSGNQMEQQSSQAESNDSASHTMTFGIQNYGGGGIDPAKEVNTAWNNSRYGVGECLFKFDDAMNVVNTLCKESPLLNTIGTNHEIACHLFKEEH